MPATYRPPTRSEFEIAIVCALGKEYDAVEAVCDEIWEAAAYGKAEGDPNRYALGRIGAFPVAVVLLPGMGKEAAASGSAFFRASFPRIELCLLVGICAGFPHDAAGDDVRLGDPIISTSVIQSDAGRQFPDDIVRKNTIEDNYGRHSKDVRSVLNYLATTRTGQKQLHLNTINYLRPLIQDHEDGYEIWGYPETVNDHCFQSLYDHRHYPPAVCTICDNRENRPCAASQLQDCTETRCEWQCAAHVVAWKKTRKTMEGGRFTKGHSHHDPALVAEPHIHFGVFSSADQVLRSTKHRDLRNAEDKVIAYEMEGAGVWDNFNNVIIIKSVCDYADSHKNKHFQRYAAATAAACSKAFLAEWARDKYATPQTPSTNAGASRPEPAAGLAASPAGSTPASAANAQSNVFSGRFEAGRSIFQGTTFNSGGGPMNF